MSEVAVKRCSCGHGMTPAGQRGLWTCTHCDSPCTIKGCPACLAQAKSTRP